MTIGESPLPERSKRNLEHVRQVAKVVMQNAQDVVDILEKRSWGENTTTEQFVTLTKIAIELDQLWDELSI